MADQFDTPLQPQVMEPPKEVPYEAIGGWLWYFCLVFMVLSPVGIARALAKSTHLSWIITYIVLLIFTMLAGITTAMRAKSAFTFVWLALIMRLIYAGLQLHIAYSFGGIANQAQLVTQNITSGLVNIFLSISWFWYFKVSYRVRRTFGRNL
jgi:hypothetical protein